MAGLSSESRGNALPAGGSRRTFRGPLRMTLLVPMPAANQDQSELLAYCASCRGVLPFDVSGSRLACRRCGTLYRRTDPGAAIRRRAVRYFLYSLAAGLLPIGIGIAVTAVGPSHPLVTLRETTLGLIAGVVALACLAHAIRLFLG